MIVCDAHPLVEGHVLIVPKKHYSCIGEYPDILLEEFKNIYEKVSRFIDGNYGPVCGFEHGKVGQTVFHSHVHLLPCKCKETDIIFEGPDKLKEINDFKNLKTIFENDGQYLFFSVSGDKYVVDCSIGAPRFFRDRFANALDCSERADWKEMHSHRTLMQEAEIENASLISKWNFRT